MPDYKNGKIYKLVCSETQQIYIGSTIMPLYKRLFQHKKLKDCSCRNFIEPKIFLIEDFPCERKEQLNSRERQHIEKNDCVNIQRPGRTLKEYYQDNKIEIIKKICNYGKNNKEKINERLKKPYSCICGSNITWGCKTRHEKSQKHKNYIQNNE